MPPRPGNRELFGFLLRCAYMTSLMTFPALPTPDNADGQPRRTGVEIEFGDISQDEAAKICQKEVGGQIDCDETGCVLKNSEIGDIQIYLDTALRKSSSTAIKKMGLELGGDIIPVELVSEPLDYSGLALLDRVRAALRDHGAVGTHEGWLLGFGVHLNVEIVSDDSADIVRPLLAFALIEDWLRHEPPIDASRRVLPFTAPYPTDFVARLCKAGPAADWRDVMRIYLDETPSRNRGLDMLPIFEWLDADAVHAAFKGKNSPRPAFHFRLPDCRINEPDWSLRDGWDTWCLVERIALDDALLDRLSYEWQDDHGPITLSRASWARRSEMILRETVLEGARS